ncbi:hypothetical protein PGN05_24120, partial [Geodermatophilus sp. CPCC 206100]
MTDLATARHGPAPGPGLPTGAEPQPVEPPPDVAGGLELTRLIALARLTAPQALEIGAGLVAEAARRPEPGAGSPGGDRVDLGRTVVRADGRVALRPAAVGGSGRPPAAGPTVEALLADVAGAARHRARGQDAAPEPLLDALDRAVAELPAAGAPAVARDLAQAAAAIDRGAVRGELAALVRAAGAARGAG